MIVWLRVPDGAWRAVSVEREHYVRLVALASGPNGDPTISLVEPRRKTLRAPYYGPERRHPHATPRLPSLAPMSFTASASSSAAG